MTCPFGHVPTFAAPTEHIPNHTKEPAPRGAGPFIITPIRDQPAAAGVSHFALAFSIHGSSAGSFSEYFLAALNTWSTW